MIYIWYTYLRRGGLTLGICGLDLSPNDKGQCDCSFPRLQGPWRSSWSWWATHHRRFSQIKARRPLKHCHTEPARSQQGTMEIESKSINVEIQCISMYMNMHGLVENSYSGDFGKEVLPVACQGVLTLGKSEAQGGRFQWWSRRDHFDVHLFPCEESKA